MLQGQYTKAQGLYLTMLDQEGMVREMDQVDVGRDLLRVAKTYSKTGNYARAEHYQSLALAVMKKKVGGVSSMDYKRYGGTGRDLLPSRSS